MSNTSNTSEPLALSLASACAGLRFADLDPATVSKVRVCLMDMLGSACEAQGLPWSRQAHATVEAQPDSGQATIIGASDRVAAADAAFVNAVMAHGLVREDTHPGSVSHLGVVVFPALLAVAQTRRVSGRDFIAAAVAGYEVGAVIGRALIDPTLARIHRPTGITGPIAAAAALARLLSLDPAQTATAICLAANTIAGFNEWAHTGGSDMYFQAGFAARNAIYAVRLAAAGAFASATALDGPAGLFAALGKRDRAAGVIAFRDTPEILAVYHKPAAGCNFAQTACQAALILAKEHAFDAHEIERVTVRLPRAAMLYPGCDYAGPFASMLQAKMSIQYNVACALAGGGRLPAASEQVETAVVGQIAARIELFEDAALTAVYPQRQGAAVEVGLACGRRFAASLDDVVTASPDQVRLRFLDAAAALFGTAGAQAIHEGIADMEESTDVGALAAQLTLAPRA